MNGLVFPISFSDCSLFVYKIQIILSCLMLCNSGKLVSLFLAVFLTISVFSLYRMDASNLWWL